MDNFLTLSPELIATGKVTREQITNLIMQSATECDLLPLDKLRFYRTLEKAAAEAAKAIDEKYGAPITEVAVEHAESLPQLHEALAEGKKEFVYVPVQGGLDYRLVGLQPIQGRGCCGLAEAEGEVGRNQRRYVQPPF